MREAMAGRVHELPAVAHATLHEAVKSALVEPSQPNALVEEMRPWLMSINVVDTAQQTQLVQVFARHGLTSMKTLDDKDFLDIEIDKVGDVVIECQLNML